MEITRSETVDQESTADFWVGDYLVEPELNRIVSKDGKVIRVEPKLMQVLLYLAENPGKPVTKEKFMERVWCDTVVTDDVLLRSISVLRKVFGDNPRKPRFIETIHKTGYRLIAPVSVRTEDDFPAQPEAAYAPEEAAPAPPALEAPAVRPALQPARALFRRPFHESWYRFSAVTLLAALLGSIVWVLWTYTPALLAPPKTVPLTSFPGEETDPALSPDGNQVAFAWHGASETHFDIYIKQIGAETPLRITDHPADERSPVWSPDGLHLAFIRVHKGIHSISIIPAVGGSEREVANLGERDIQGLSWSPDGKTLVLSAQPAPHEAYSLYALSVETLAEQRLTTPPADSYGDMDPALSPDGQHLAFARNVAEMARDLYVVPLKGGEPKRLTSDHAEITGLDWTPDGKSIVFASTRRGPSSLWKVSAMGGEPEWMMTAGEGSTVLQPSVARNGGRISFAQRSFDTNIWRLRLDQNAWQDAVRPLISSTQWDSNPHLSPDGAWITFASSRSGSYEIWKCDAQGANPLQLTQFEGGFTNTPRWSPDGKRIAFTSRQKDNTDVYVIDAGGGKPIRLTTDASHDVSPTWSRDGRWVYFASNRSDAWQIWKISADGGRPVQVTRNGGLIAFESTDQASLYYVKRDAPGIWRMPLSGGAEARIEETLEPDDWGNWAVVEHGIYFIRRDTPRPSVAFYSFASGRSRRMAILESIPKHPGFTIAPDGSWFLYTRVDQIESDILLVEDLP